MGKLSYVKFSDSDYTLSLVHWGILRRFQSKKQGFMELTGALFIPEYELAVWEGLATVEVVNDKMPALVLYYPDKPTAQKKFAELEVAIGRGGLFGRPVRDFIPGADPQKQHRWLVSAAMNESGNEE